MKSPNFMLAPLLEVSTCSTLREISRFKTHDAWAQLLSFIKFKLQGIELLTMLALAASAAKTSQKIRALSK